MGLDLVELVMAIEEAFLISIPDEDAAPLGTPRKLVDYLERRLVSSNRSLRAEQRAFHLLRRAGMRVLGRPRSEFAPETRWDQLLPVDERGRIWDRLRVEAASQNWPTRPFWRGLPVEQATVGDTAVWLATFAPADIRRGEGWSRSEIERTVAACIREQLGIESFDWDDRFVEDLHAD
jgi:acyl carrier protein